MVSLQASALSMEEKKLCSLTEKSSMKKRKRVVSEADKEALQLKETKLWKSKLPKLDSPVELNLDTAPLPLEWQRCLDIKSGEIHFYNTRTKRRTFEDPRWSPDTHRPRPTMNLELNLMCEPSETLTDDLDAVKAKDDAEATSSPALVLADGAVEQEMVAAVCARCHMLVMMCKALPSCPNCKFTHPPESQSSSEPARMATLRLWCYGDK